MAVVALKGTGTFLWLRKEADAGGGQREARLGGHDSGHVVQETHRPQAGVDGFFG